MTVNELIKILQTIKEKGFEINVNTESIKMI